MKRNRIWVIATVFITMIPMIAGALLWKKLPETVPVHFDISGKADSYAGKAFAVIVIPVFLAVMQLVVAGACKLDSKLHGDRRIDDKLMHMIFLIIPAVSLFSCAAIYAYASGISMNINSLVQLMLGFIFTGTGLSMREIPQNYAAGIRLPWTIRDEENWKMTHAAGGKIFTAAGIIIFLNGLLNFFGKGGPVIISIITIAAAAAACIIYSFMLFLKEK